MKKIVIAALLGATLLGGATYAATTATPQTGGRAMRADANGDGAVTLAEMQAATARRFAVLDANKDGRITPAEMRASRPHGGRGGGHRRHGPAGQDGRTGAGGPHGGILARADANGDGVVTQAELLAQVQARFVAEDANRDGRVDASERPARGPMTRRGNANGDGAITLAEQRDRALKLFARMDANHDGRIDAAERFAMRERMERRGRGPGHGPAAHGQPGEPSPPEDAPDEL
jgi:5-hydroxyisourate hydrolase-like protein (transthyretin family)